MSIISQTRLQKFQVEAFRVTALACAAIGLAVVTGCQTPSEIKTASRKQVELIAAARDAAGELQKGLDQFHRDMEQTTREEGRIFIARAAINDAAKASPSGVTADRLFEISNQDVRPWVDYVFAEPDFDKAIDQLTKRIDSTTNQLVKISLGMDLDDLKLTKSGFAKKLDSLKALEGVLQAEMDADAEQRKKINSILDVLKAQLDVMGVLASTVDTWLGVDVTVSQGQMDALEKTVVDSKKALDK